MNIFLRKISLFFLSAVFFVLSFHYLIYSALLSNEDYFKIENGMSTVVLGDSHTETSIRDDATLGLKNLSFRGESVFLTYYKLRRLIEVNQQIENVVLAFSFYTLNEFRDEQLNRTFKDYFWLLDAEGLQHLNYTARNAILMLREADSQLFKWGVSNVKETIYFLLTGGYRKMDVSNVSEETSQERLWGHYFKKDKKNLQDQSVLQKAYLEKIVLLCEKNNIKITFINTPLHKTYSSNIPKNYLSDYYADVDNYIARYPGLVSHLDFMNSIVQDTYFHDGDHLNSTGSVVFTEILHKRLLELNIIKDS
ncbi:hypothetical protein A9Q81_15330 [Gammaproteobacteria bacterium 42_54_T18]|nr:hypothetical protein A9Q81_15330 [Gammaproteobacteria bacterium 42_54_T18]